MQLNGAVEISHIIKFAVVRQTGFANEGIGQSALQQFTVLGHKGSVIFTHVPILIIFSRVDGNVAKNHNQALRGSYYFFAIGSAVFEKGFLLPQIS